jgi:hypothetical protein
LASRALQRRVSGASDRAVILIAVGSTVAAFVGVAVVAVIVLA